MARIIGEVLNFPAVSVHHVDFRPVVIPIGNKGNAFAIGRPRGCMVITAIIGEVFQIPTTGVHHVDFPVPIPIGSEGNLFAIR